MHFIKWILRKKILIGLMVVLILLVGSYAINKLDKELLPSVTFDGAYVTLQTNDMTTTEIERSITTPLEQSLLAIDGVEEVQSSTSSSVSSFQIMLESGKGDDIFPSVESTVHSTAAELNGIRDVEVGQIGSNQSYEFFMDVSGGDMEEMSDFATDILEPRLEALPEVRDVSLMGLLEHEIIIQFNRKKMLQAGLDINQAIAFIQQANSEATIGELNTDQTTASLRWNSTLTSVEEIEILEIPTPSGTTTLAEIATVQEQPLASSSFVWKDGTQDFIFAQVGRTADVTQIEMANAVRQEMEKIREENLIQEFELNEIVAQADYVEDAIDGVTTNIILGAIIAIAILLIFLRNIRATIIIGVSIPTSILLTFAAMWIFEYSFNMLTLIGLGLGVGMMVDSSIVILESIYRKKEEGMKGFDAVVHGTKEVAAAVIASMLTTIVVFVPIGLLGGDLGQFIIMLSMVVAITLISSVIVAFSLIPALADKFLKVKKERKKRTKRLLPIYSKLVAWIVRKKRHSLAIIGVFSLVFIGSLFLITKIPTTLMPDFLNRYQELVIDIEDGLSEADKEELIAKINEELSQITDVETNYVLDEGNLFFSIINMTKGDDITTEQEEVNEQILTTLRDLQESYPIESVQGAMSAGGGAPVQVNIKGEDFEQLQLIAENFKTELQSVEGIAEIKHSMENSTIEQVIALDQEALKQAGISNTELKGYLESSFLHAPISETVIEGSTVPLVATWDESIETESDLLNVSIPTQTGEESLASFISLNQIDTPNTINRIDGERYISVTADMEGTDLGTVNREVQAIINDFDAPTDYSISLAGDLEEQQQLMQEMLLILAIAIFLVYLVMAVQFNHLGHPLLVMSVIPMTIVGVIVGLFLTQRELSALSAMGVIMLIGIVLNNAILFIDRTNQLRKQGFTVNDAIIAAGENRIRPIFITTLTTAGGMLPLALATGTSGNYQAPMATVIITGLLFATFITLVLIPTVYRLFTRKAVNKQAVNKKGAILQAKENIS